MIEKKYYDTRPDGVELYQRTSTLKVKIRQIETGEAYDDPIDIEPCPYTYEETEIPIDDTEPKPEPEPEPTGDLTVSDTLQMLNQMGVDISDQ